jgi:hypothetical protein
LALEVSLKRNNFVKAVAFFLGFSFLFVTFASSASAQPMKNWTWKKYNLKFKLPRYMKITRKRSSGSVNKLVAKGKGLTVEIVPWRNRSIRNARQAAWSAYRKFTVTKRKRITAQRRVNFSSRLQGYVFFGKGYQGSRSLSFAILGLINPNSSVNLYVRFQWWSTSDSRNKALSGRVARTFNLIR